VAATVVVQIKHTPAKFQIQIAHKILA
jgi:hypothetical protein